MDNGTPDSVVAKWTTAITDIDLEAVQQLLSSHGDDLLWQPLDKDAFINHRDIVAQLEQAQQLLGNDLDNMSAIPFLLLDLDENATSLKGEEHIMQRKRSELLQFLIKVSIGSFYVYDLLVSTSWHDGGLIIRLVAHKSKRFEFSFLGFLSQYNIAFGILSWTYSHDGSTCTTRRFHGYQ